MPTKITALLGVTILAAAVSGCASQQHDAAAVHLTGSEQAPFVQTEDSRRYATSWSYSNRVGAAVQKAAYQHFLTTDAMIFSAHGRLHEEPIAEAGHVPYPVAVSFPAEPTSSLSNATGVDTLGALTSCPGTRIISSAREMTSEYIAVRNKLCAGAQRLTYEEWLVLVNGTPKDVPAHLQP
ncbi:MAG: hypothetical protein KAI85_15915 [Halopseudomonas aestusnigri]|nr:hypothetical protein [Halopseudomonas aestusnigri]